MKGEGYTITLSEDATEYCFDSSGKRGVIRKKVVFFLLFENTWNLGFGDSDGNDFDDTVISNNHDVRKTMQTIVNIIHHFFERKPDSKIYIRPVDEKRKKLYNSIFRRKHLEVNEVFGLFGRIGNQIEPFRPEIFYDAFLIQRKVQ